jgi:hypothetical protein
LKWSISETCANTRRIVPLWATQGERHQHRRAVFLKSPFTPALVETLLEPEAQSLEQRYGHDSKHQQGQFLGRAVGQKPGSREKELEEIRAKCIEFEIASFHTVTLQEEQERELSPENEREQEIELPPALLPCRHKVHRDVRRLITKGVLNQSSDTFRPAFETLCNTTASDHFEPTAWPQELLVTTDFMTTVQAEARQDLDSFLRPVHWIISCKNESPVRFVILSPYEVQELLPAIRQYSYVTLHIYSPRLSKTTRTLETLSFCAIPAAPDLWSIPPVVAHLNLFAGQLYIRSYEDYESLCSFLGLCSNCPDDNLKVGCDGFIDPASRGLSKSASSKTCLFTTSPVDFLRKITSLRRKGQSFTFSHIGRILNGELIAREHFD